MKILAIDTATEACSVALYFPSENGAATEWQVDSHFDILPQQHSQQILPMVDALLRKNKIKITELDAIAYGRGPGSFTGVRIAASTVQGLALGADVPVVEVSTLATMAQQVFMQTGQTQILALIDARMQEVYLGHFEIVNGIAQALSPEQVLGPELALQLLQTKAQTAGIAGTGFAAYAEMFASDLQNRELDVEYPNAEFMLPLAIQAIEQGNTIASENITPVYIRDKVTWKKLPHKA